MPISVEKFLEIAHLLLQFAALVGVAYEHAAVGHLHNLRGAEDVGAALHGIGRIGKGLVLNEFEAAAVVNQRVAGDARLLMVGL